jgi:hypothetical protein
MSNDKEIEADISRIKEESRMKEARELIGKGIISGLLRPGRFGISIDVLENYNQGDGGYWQYDGGTHTQNSGDYHQGSE